LAWNRPRRTTVSKTGEWTKQPSVRKAPAGARTCRWGCLFPELPVGLDGDDGGGKLQNALDADAFSEVVERACDTTSMNQVSIENRAKLLPDSGITNRLAT
jgi:hypothetical protein